MFVDCPGIYYITTTVPSVLITALAMNRKLVSTVWYRSPSSGWMAAPVASANTATSKPYFRMWLSVHRFADTPANITFDTPRFGRAN